MHFGKRRRKERSELDVHARITNVSESTANAFAQGENAPRTAPAKTVKTKMMLCKLTSFVYDNPLFSAFHSMD